MIRTISLVSDGFIFKQHVLNDFQFVIQVIVIIMVAFVAFVTNAKTTYCVNLLRKGFKIGTHVQISSTQWTIRMDLVPSIDTKHMKGMSAFV